MEYDDIIYLFCLVFSILFGYVYRKIEDVELRKIVGTIVGLGITLFVSGIHTLHLFIFTFTNIFIIKCLSKDICHLISFGFSFMYLIFFRTTLYFGIPYAPSHTNLIIMIQTLKLVGLAFELNTTQTKRKQIKTESNDEQIAEFECKQINPGVFDIFTYAFNYVGLLAGPYYTYRTYLDSMHSNIQKFAPCTDETIKKLFYTPLYSLLFLLATYTWPFSYALSDEFYQDRSVLYRLWYSVIIFFIFRMRIYIGIILSECACTMSGLGAYPIQTEPKAGAGPTKNFVVLKEIHEHPEKGKTEQFDFETIHNIHPYGAEFCTTFREGMKHWNMCVQYWLAVNIYKRLPSKKFRTLITMFISALWHGVYIGHYFTICGAPFYLLVEDIYSKLYLKENKKNLIMWQWIIYIWKWCAFSYLSVAFHMLTVPKVMHYYNSVYHLGFVVGAIMYLIGNYLLIERKKEQNRMEKEKQKKVE